MKSILIITSSVDYTVDYIIEKYNTQYKFYRVNIDMFNRYVFNCSYEHGFNIRNDFWNIYEEDIDAIYYRKPMLPDLTDYDSKYHTMISRDIISYINGMVDSFQGKVLSRPYTLRKTENKIYQVKMAKMVGFNVAECAIGTDRQCINNLIEENSIIKPLTTGKIVEGEKCEIMQTSLINKKINDDISKTPIYIQKYIEKEYEARVTIVNKSIFAVKIEGFNKIDWRIDEHKNKYSIIDIPDRIKEQCFELMDVMKLDFGAFDFIIDKNGQYIFLEVNPNGQWLWLEEKLNLRISQKILEYLGE